MNAFSKAAPYVVFVFALVVTLVCARIECAGDVIGIIGFASLAGGAWAGLFG